MEYCTLQELKTHLGIADNTEDESLSMLISTLTSLVDLELGRNIGIQVIERRVSGMGKNRIIMEGSINSVDGGQVKVYNSFVSNDYSINKVSFIDGSILHLEKDIPKGNKNVLIKYTRGFDQIPNDIKVFFLKYCKEMRNIQKSGERILESKKVEGLQVSYFSPSEINQAKKDSPLTDFATILKKYKNFTSISY